MAASEQRLAEGRGRPGASAARRHLGRHSGNASSAPQERLAGGAAAVRPVPRGNSRFAAGLRAPPPRAASRRGGAGDRAERGPGTGSGAHTGALGHAGTHAGAHAHHRHETFLGGQGHTHPHSRTPTRDRGARAQSDTNVQRDTETERGTGRKSSVGC